jgi:hypothetical protein
MVTEMRKRILIENREDIVSLLVSLPSELLLLLTDELETEVLRRAANDTDLLFYLNILKRLFLNKGITTGHISDMAIGNLKRYVIPLFASNRQQAVHVLPLFVNACVAKYPNLNLNRLLCNHIHNLKLFMDMKSVLLQG